MNKKLTIFGNGLGMALNPEHFHLTKAMERVWNDSSLVSDEEKELIGALKGIESETGPTSEDELISTQYALTLLSQFRHQLGEDALDSWFTTDAKNFPETLQKYVFQIAHELYNYELEPEALAAWEPFIKSFIKFVVDTRSHVATLNYDDLLYEKIVNGVCIEDEWYIPSRGPNGRGAPFVRDGFINGRFAPASFEWAGGSGYYMHLHGTALFASRDGQNIKLERNEVDFTPETARRHIVLANRRTKSEIIKQSEILSDLWENRLLHCISDAQDIILFGYSGLDDHLNEKLIEAEDKTKWIVEWRGSKHYDQDTEVTEGDPIDAQTFWANAVGENSKVLQLENILSFRDWSDPSKAF